MYFDSGHKCASVKVKFDVKEILVRLNTMYPELDLLQYEESLRGLDIYYLETANMFETYFYESNQVGMTDKAAGVFRQHISTEYNRALLAYERGKMRERREHQIAHGNGSTGLQSVP